MPLATRFLTPRARKDFADCIAFVERHASGRAGARLFDILQAFQQIRWLSQRHRVERRLASGIDLRRAVAAQFIIFYSYYEPGPAMPDGLVSIRAICHRRVRDVFCGVRDSQPYSGTYHT